MIDWSHIGFSGSILALGLIGFIGVTLLPIRAFKLLRRHAISWRSSVANRVAFVLLVVATMAVVLYGLPHLARVFACLTDMRCGANRAGGMISLALFGVGYLAFEAVAFLSGLFSRTRGAAA
jgi:hypothetical protein